MPAGENAQRYVHSTMLRFPAHEKEQFSPAPGILARMPIQIDQFVRSRRRTIAIQVRPDGQVWVRAPLRAPEKLIHEFVESKAGWIRQKQADALKHAPVTEKHFRVGERFLFLGREYSLGVVEKQRTALTFEGQFILSQKAMPRAAQAFEQWYKAQALKVLSERVRYYAAKHGFQPGRIRISSARTRWGSCSSKGTLSFTWRLVMAPLEVIDYVVIHELVHLKVKNHSKTFWGSVAALMPDYKKYVAWLKKNGSFLTL
jgi:predicted metal-dependent hydrolase